MMGVSQSFYERAGFAGYFGSVSSESWHFGVAAFMTDRFFFVEQGGGTRAQVVIKILFIFGFSWSLILNLIFKINNKNYYSVDTKLLKTTKIDHFYLQIYLKYQTSSITLKSANWSRPQRQNWLVVWHKTSRSARSLVFFDLLARSHIPQDIVLISLTAHGTRTSAQVASCRERDDIVIYCNPLVGVVLEAATHYRPAEATNYYWAVWCLLARSEEIGVVNVAL